MARAAARGGRVGGVAGGVAAREERGGTAAVAAAPVGGRGPAGQGGQRVVLACTVGEARKGQVLQPLMRPPLRRGPST